MYTICSFLRKHSDALISAHDICSFTNITTYRENWQKLKKLIICAAKADKTYVNLLWMQIGYYCYYPKSCKQVFFSQDSKETCSLIFVSVIKKEYQENISFVKPLHIMYVFFKGIIEKTNCYWHLHFFFDVY